ncbi:hypothetical protein [Nocardioides sp. GXQ0305]|uniref:hypothetical protein n=1 Tax=Nocardioides sp. GXQ0305 TaxID=3423912 RepID=UPI003D7DDFA4
MKDLSRGLEALIAVLTGVLGAPIVAGLWWAAFSSPACDTGLGTVECVVSASGEHWSWASLAASPEAVVLGFVLAAIAFIGLEMVNERSNQST